jgi:hypothetical protein
MLLQNHGELGNNLSRNAREQNGILFHLESPLKDLLKNEKKLTLINFLSSNSVKS